MRLLARLQAWWRSSAPVRPAPRLPAEPLDYAPAYCLHSPPGGAAAVPGTWQAAFPTLTAARAAAVQQQLLRLQDFTMDLGSQVNAERLTGAAAHDCLWAAYPQLDRGNLATLLWQACVATR